VQGCGFAGGLEGLSENRQKFRKAHDYTQKRPTKSNVSGNSGGRSATCRHETTGGPMRGEDPTRDLIISATCRFGLTAFLCWLPIWKFGWNAEGAGLAVLVFFPCAFMLSKPIMGIAAELGIFVARQPLKQFQGSYYNFAGVQIRCIEVGKELWVVDRDLLAVIGEKPTLMLESLYNVHEYDEIPDTEFSGFSPEGAEKVLKASTHTDAGRMWLWLQREVYKPHAKKLELLHGR
jgi:hypothetical protein